MRKHFTTRLPDQLAQALADRAEVNHRSANAELTAILTGAAPALSGTATAQPTLNQARVVARMIPDLAPYKAALQRMIDDSAALREKYEDLDSAVEQARGLL